MEWHGLGEPVIVGDYNQFVCWGERIESDGLISCELAWLNRNGSFKIKGVPYSSNATGKDGGIYTNLILIPNETLDSRTNSE